MDFAKPRQFLDLKLLCFLVLISISFIYQQQASATVYTLTTPYPNISPAISHNVNITGTMKQISVSACGQPSPTINFIDPTTHKTISYTNPIGSQFPCTVSFVRFDTSSLPSTINVTSVKLFLQNHIGNNMDVACGVSSVPDDPNTASASTLYTDYTNFISNAGYNTFTDCESSNTNQIGLEELNQTNFIGNFISKRLNQNWYAFSIFNAQTQLGNFNRTADLGPIKLNVKYFDYNNTPANSARALILNPTNSCSSNFYASNFNKTTSASDNTSTHPFPECSAMIWRYDVTGIPINAQISQVNITEGIASEQFFTSGKLCLFGGLTHDPNLGSTSGTTIRSDFLGNSLGGDGGICNTVGNKNFNAGTTFKNFFINNFKNGWFAYSTNPQAEAGVGGQNFVVFNATGLKITAHVPTLTLVPTSGNVGSSVTASGTGFLNATVTTTIKKDNQTTFNAFDGHIFLQKFTGLTASGHVTGVGYFANSPAGDVRVKVYADDGTAQHIITNSAGADVSNANTGWFGTVWVTKITGIPVGTKLIAAGYNSVIASGNIRMKVYADDNGTGYPKTLLGESASTPMITGFNYVPLTATVPASGNVYVGWEISGVGATMGFGGSSGTTWTTVTTLNGHTYGAGPDPFGVVNKNIGGRTIQVAVESSDYNYTIPKTLLGESSSLVTVGGQHIYPLSAIIPANGNLWAGFEFDSSANNLFYNSTVPSGTTMIQTHAYGAGPTTFSATNFTQALWTSVKSTGSDPITLKWDGSTLTTNPTVVNADDTGAFSGVIFNVPSATGGNHIVNASDTSIDWASATYSVNAQYTVSLRPTLHDGVTPITSGKLIVTQNGVTIGTGNTNSSGYATVSNLNSGNYNFTILDDKNFAVYKELNTNVASNIAKNVSTYDTPFNCVSPFTGYQSDFIIRINDTDGTHITSISTPTCPNQNQLKFNMTFTGNGQSGNTFSSSMITTAGTQVYAANPSSFTVSGTSVPTTFTGGNNIVSNSFSIGSGLVTTTKTFIMNLTATQSTNLGAGSSGQNYFTTNSTCFAGVYDPKTSSCVFGLVNITAPPVIITTNPNTQQNGGVEVDCSGNGYITITSANLGSNPLGITLGQLPVNIQCGQTTPTTCPAGTTLTNGVCIAPLTCPVGSQTQNGICTAPLTCPAGTTLQNAQCIAPTTCADGSQPVNGQCNNIVPIILPPTPSPCDITNPLSCITSTTQSQDVVVTGVTPDGKPISVTTTVTKVLNPELNNVSLVIILLIIAAIIAGIIYRYLTRKKKPKGRKVKNYSGNGNKIDKFNKKVKNEV